MTRMDSMLSKSFESHRGIRRPPPIRHRPALRMALLLGAVPGAAALGVLIGQAIKLLR